MKKEIRIMIADDIRLLLEDMEDLINRQQDMKVVGTAMSGKKIVELASELEYDLILMDIEMETTNAGIKATEKIRDLHSDAKIIYLTAHETKDMILTAVGSGAVDYIVKGASEEKILEHIRSAYRGEPLLDSKIRELVMQEFVRLRQSEEGLLFFINNISNLTNAERELIGYLLEGMKIKEIAGARSVEVTTVKSQINTLLKKFGASRTKEIVKKVKELKLVHLFN